MTHLTRIRLVLLAGTVSLCACQTVKMPNLDNVIKSPEFSEQAAEVAKDYPKVKDAPVAPTDIRSAAAWDQDARRMQALRGEFSTIEMESGPSKPEANARFEALKDKAQAYKQDDPASGPIEGFPEIPTATPKTKPTGQ